MRALFVIYIALVILAVSACQKSSNDATVPGMSTECLNNPSACNTQLYQNTPGFYPYNNVPQGYNPYGYSYNYSYNYSYGSPYGNLNQLCNCPAGSVPTYNGYSGLGCVQTQLVYGYSTINFTYTNNSQWTNIPQISNVVGYTNQGCYNGVIQSCLVNAPSTCQVGYSCRVTSAESALGVCVSSNSNPQFGQVFR